MSKFSSQMSSYANQKFPLEWPVGGRPLTDGRGLLTHLKTSPYFGPGKGVVYCTEHVRLSRTHISKTTLPKFTQFSVHVDIRYCGLDVLWRRCGAIYLRFCRWRIFTHNFTHLPKPLHPIGYRHRLHSLGLQLPSNTTCLSDSDFIVRMLFKDKY